MSKSQTRRLREATKMFGRENWGRWYSSRLGVTILAYEKKKAAGLLPHEVFYSKSTGPVATKRYSTSFTYEENESVYGRPQK